MHVDVDVTVDVDDPPEWKGPSTSTITCRSTATSDFNDFEMRWPCLRLLTSDHRNLIIRMSVTRSGGRRTTLTLDDDVAARLESLMRTRRTGLKQAVNEALRAGLDQIERRPSSTRKPFRQKTFSLDPRNSDLDNVAEVLARADGEVWR